MMSPQEVLYRLVHEAKVSVFEQLENCSRALPQYTDSGIGCYWLRMPVIVSNVKVLELVLNFLHIHVIRHEGDGLTESFRITA